MQSTVIQQVMLTVSSGDKRDYIRRLMALLEDPSCCSNQTRASGIFRI